MTNLSSLQALNALCCTVRSFLGPDQRIKCILEDEDEDSCLVSSCSEVLCNLDVKHPVGQVAVEACSAHHKAHGTGTTTLMAMTGLWAVEMEALLTQGVPIVAIVKYGDECLEQCLAALETITVPCTVPSTDNTEPNRTPKHSDLQLQAQALVHSHTPCNSESYCSTEESHGTHEHVGNLDRQKNAFVRCENVRCCNSDKSSTSFEVSQSRAINCHSTKRILRSGPNCGNTLGTSLDEFDIQKEKPAVLDDDDEAQFVEVQFNDQSPNSTPSKSEADLAVIDSPRNSEPESIIEDDDILWFFERDSNSLEYSLEQHRSDCGALLKVFDGEDIDDEFDSSLPTEKSPLSRKIPKERITRSLVTEKQVKDDSDGEFDSCFPPEDNNVIPKSPVENATRKPAQDEIDEFDSCFPMEESDTSQEFPMKNARDGSVSNQELKDDKENGEFDSCFSTGISEAGSTAEQQESYPRVGSNEPKCNITSREVVTINRNPSAIQESIQSLLHAKREKTNLKRHSRVQNNSRHFRSVETVMDQHIFQTSGLTSSCRRNEAAMKIVDTIESSGLKGETATTQRLANKVATDHYQRTVGTSSSLNVDNSDYQASGGSTQASEIEEAGEKVKEINKKMAARRLANVQNNSRDLRTAEPIIAHGRLENADLTSGQEFDPEVMLAMSEILEEHLTVPSSDKQHPTESSDTMGGVQNKIGHLQEDRHLQSQDFFCEADMNSSSNGQITQNSGGMQEPDIVQLGLGLSHGSGLEMRLAVESFKMQKDYTGRNYHVLSRWPDLNQVNVCTVAGPPRSQSHLQDGVLVPIDHHQRSAIAEAEGQCLRALLVNGDATSTFRHAGYKNKVKATAVDTWTGLLQTGDKSWLRDTVILLQELDIKLIVLKGHADERLLHHCLSKKIFLLQDVSYKTLQALAEASSAPILTYLSDATMDDAACGTTVACWESGWVDRTKVKRGVETRKLFARICVAGKLLQTAVLCHPVSSLLPASEARFWTCARRLQGTVHDGRFLPGAGLPEQVAVRQLQRLKGSNSNFGNHGNLSFYRNTIISAFAEAFVNYLVQVLKNMGKLVDISQAKALVMSHLQRDKFEPVLSGSIQSRLQQQNLCASLATFDTLKSNTEFGLNQLEPDLSCSIQSEIQSSCQSCTTSDKLMSHDTDGLNWQEPGLSCSIRSELQYPRESYTTCDRLTSNGTSNTDDISRLEPDVSGHSQSVVAAARSLDVVAHESSSCSCEFTRTSDVFSPLEKDSSRLDLGNGNQDMKYDPRKKSPGRFTDESGQVYDSYTAKRAAWESAWVLLKTVCR